MPYPLPIPPYPYDDDTRATIAGFLLQDRAGVLQAARSTGTPVSGATFGWAEAEHLYWLHAESYSRYLLDKLGYPVVKHGLYKPPTD